jgi:hypothetical protein
VRLVPLLGLLLGGCAWIGGGAFERVDDRDVVEFAERIDRFYASLEGRSLDSMMTFEDERLRSYFDRPGAFSDYYASLANQVRDADFRFAAAERVEIREFRFQDERTARVELWLFGRHFRRLRFWQLRLARTDTWWHNGDDWVVAPDRL